jgi:hypothetical protein
MGTKEGGVLNGHGPLDLPLDQFFIQVTSISAFYMTVCDIKEPSLNRPVLSSSWRGS